MEKIIDLLKVLLGKHLYPAISSIAMAILFVALKPNLFGIEKRVGKTLYGVLVFCIFFLIFELTKYISKSYKTCQANQKAYQQEQELNKQEQERQRKLQEENELYELENLWNYVDSLDVADQQYLLQFLKTKNEPIEKCYDAFSKLFNNSKFMVCTSKPVKNLDENNSKNLDLIFCNSGMKLYKLRDDFYQTLKLSYEKYHRISHFDLEEH